jgi:AsmA protein
MRRALLISILCCAGLVLLVSTGLGIVLACFTPEDYARKISAAVEKATGRQLQFQDGISISFFPTPSLKTGRMLMQDPGIFGGGVFFAAEEASAVLSVQHLLQGVLQLEEVHLESPELHLVTTASGQHNWEYGVTSGSAVPPEPGAGATPGGASAGETGADSGGSTPLAENVRTEEPKSGLFSRLRIQVERVTLSNARARRRNLRTGASWTGTVDSLSVNSIRQDADMPFAAAGRLTDDSQERSALFSLKGSARFDAAGAASVRVDVCDLEFIGPSMEKITMKNRLDLAWDPAGRSLDLRGLKGALDDAVYEGKLALTLPQGKKPVLFTGELTVSTLNLDALLDKMTAVRPAPVAGDPKGAPNLTRPKVAPPGSAGAVGKASENPPYTEEKQGRNQVVPGRSSLAAPPALGADGTLTLSAAALTCGRLPISTLTATLTIKDNVVSLPFALTALGGAVTGSLRADLRKDLPAVNLAVAAKSLNMESISRILALKTIVSGTLSAGADVSGRGSFWKELVTTLKGKVEFLAQNGEVRDFALIPMVRGIADVPVNFPFERLSGSGTVERGAITSKDISLRAKLLTAAGGGVVNLALERVDLGVDFMVAGNPPAIPVNITGPFSAVSSSVDIRTLMRNTAEGVLTSPEKARELLKDAEKLLLR